MEYHKYGVKPFVKYFLTSMLQEECPRGNPFRVNSIDFHFERYVTLAKQMSEKCLCEKYIIIYFSLN